jgi:TolB protein
VDRIAFIGADGYLYTMGPDGGDPRQLTHAPRGSNGQKLPVTLSFWPTWSPDGRTLAVSQATRSGPDSGVAVTLVAMDARTGETKQLYENPPVPLPIIAPGTPHYMSWAPDSSRLAFLASEAEGLAMRVSTLATGGEPPVIVQGAPLYYAWSPDSLALLLHVGDGMAVARGPALQEVRPLEGGELSFRAPAWSPDGSRILYAATDAAGQNTLVVASPTEGNSRTIASVEANVAFLWSPKGELVALLDSPHPGLPFFTRLSLARPDGQGVLTLAEEPILAFFWSPDGQRIAYAGIDLDSPDRMAWKVVGVRGEDPRKLAEFLPGQALFVLLSFFDQYAYSHSLWSPDSSRLLFSGQLPGELGVTPEDEGDIIYVVNVEGDSTPRPIARGAMATWSWR